MLVGIPQGKRLLGKSRVGWEENISIDIQETVWKGVVWDELTQDRDKWSGVMNTTFGFRRMQVSIEYLPKNWFVKKDFVARI